MFFYFFFQLSKQSQNKDWSKFDCHKCDWSDEAT